MKEKILLGITLIVVLMLAVALVACDNEQATKSELTYEQIANVSFSPDTYTVTFYDEDGETTLLTIPNLGEGEGFSYTGTTPTKEDDAQYSYTFLGWEPALENNSGIVTGNMEYVAVYTPTVKKYSIKFYDIDGSTLVQDTEWDYGSTPECTANLSTTEFVTWDPEIVSVVGEASYYAKTSGFVVENGVATAYTGNAATVIVPKSVSTISPELFKNHTEITSFSFPESLTTLGKNAFEGCTGLTEIVIPDSVKTIGEGILKGCDSLKTLTIPFVGEKNNYSNGDVSDAKYKFGYIFGYTQNTNEGGIFNASDENYYFIPSTLKEVNITSATAISSYAFYGCDNILKINLPESLTNIYRFAFNGCSSLYTINVPKNVTSISDNAFASCCRLVEIVNESKIKIRKNELTNGGISYYALNIITEEENTKIENKDDFIIYNNNTLVMYVGDDTHIVIPDYITEIRQFAFFNCTGLVEIEIPTNTTIDSIPAFMCMGCTSLEIINIPNSVTTIGMNAFRNCSSLVDISLGNGLTTINSYAFYLCSSLTNITIPNSVKSINNDAFRDCSMLMSITLPSNEQFVKISPYSFYGCSQLISVDIPDSVTSIGRYAFGSCTKIGKALMPLVLPENLEIIENYTFYNCYSLHSISIPDAVTSIGEAAFKNCIGLTDVQVGNNVTSIGFGAFGGCNSLESISLPFVGQSDAEILDNPTDANMFGYIFATSANQGMTTVQQNNKSYSIPSSLTSIVITNASAIQAHAFENLLVQNINLSTSNITDIGEYAFSGSRIESIVIPNSVETIGQYAFSNCTSLSSVTLSTNITGIPGYLFDSASALTSITIPNNVETIGQYAFSNCTALSNVTLSNNLVSLSSYAFNNCSSIRNLVIPDSVQTIETAALYGCIGLEYLSIPFVGEDREVSAITTKSINNVYYKFGYIFGYSTSYVTGTTEQNGAYYYIPKSLYKVSITDASGISAYAFNNCVNLVSISLNMEMEAIYTGAFLDCYRLVEIQNNSGISLSLGDDQNGHIAYYAKSIETSNTSKISIVDDFIIYDNSCVVSYIGTDTNIKVDEEIGGHTITEINAFAFYGCSNLQSLVVPFVGNKPISAESTNNIEYSFGYIFGNSGSSTSETITDVNGKFFYVPSTLQKVEITGGGNISFGAFSGETGLREVALLGNVVYIYNHAFNGCTNLESICIPNAITNIGMNAFRNCSALTKVYYGGTSAQKGNINIATGNDALGSATWFYFTSNGSEETSIGNWWYFDENGAIIEKIVE